MAVSAFWLVWLLEPKWENPALPALWCGSLPGLFGRPWSWFIFGLLTLRRGIFWLIPSPDRQTIGPCLTDPLWWALCSKMQIVLAVVKLGMATLILERISVEADHPLQLSLDGVLEEDWSSFLSVLLTHLGLSVGSHRSTSLSWVQDPWLRCANISLTNSLWSGEPACSFDMKYAWLQGLCHREWCFSSSGTASNDHAMCSMLSRRQHPLADTWTIHLMPQSQMMQASYGSTVYGFQTGFKGIVRLCGLQHMCSQIARCPYGILRILLYQNHGEIAVLPHGGCKTTVSYAMITFRGAAARWEFLAGLGAIGWFWWKIEQFHRLVHLKMPPRDGVWLIESKNRPETLATCSQPSGCYPTVASVPSPNIVMAAVPPPSRQTAALQPSCDGAHGVL